MAFQWPWWSTVVMFVAVLLPGVTSARSAPPDVAHALTAQGAPTAAPSVALAVAVADAVEVSSRDFGSLLADSFAADSESPPPASERATAGPAAPLFERAMVVSLYGYPGIPEMGELGRYSPDARPSRWRASRRSTTP